MNPFSTLQAVQSAYRCYVDTLQRFKNPAIRDWVLQRVAHGLLWREPYLQLSQRFQAGEPFDRLVAEGLLHPGAPRCFTQDRGKRDAAPLPLHHHQSEAVRSVLGAGANIVVATGTGSGKSFCFGIPIVSECLRLREQGVPGIKAVIVYPMNALANSQCDEFAQRLKGSGLRLALYTGDTR